jgi:BCD family chlorophyll transporter-like MFS transporter
VQVLRPRLGYGSDLGGRRTPWIIGGMAVLGLGAIGAVLATTMMPANLWLGVACAVVSFVAVGLGVGACGTTMLVLLSTSVPRERLAAAATVTWVMMIVGFIVTTVIAGRMLDPFSLIRLVEVTATVAAAAFLVTCVAVYRLESHRSAAPRADNTRADAHVGFLVALREVWAEPHSRRLASFVFVSMLAYSAQDLVLEPFAGAVFHMTPGQSTQLSGVMSSGTLVGMLLVAIVYWLCERAHRSPWGRVQRAIRDNESAAAAAGKHVERFRLASFVFGAMVMGLGGAMPSLNSVGQGSATPDYQSMSVPSVWRTNRTQATAKVDALSAGGMDDFEIPAFLRRSGNA